MVRLLCVVLVACLILTGCATNPFAKKGPGPGEPGAGEPPLLSEPGLRMASEQRFPDIPLPVGLKEDIERSYIYESATVKLGRMVYTSRDSMNALANFFLKECKNMGWNLESVLTAEGHEMIFKKPDKRLTVSIRSRGISRGQLVVIHFTPSEGSVSSVL